VGADGLGVDRAADQRREGRVVTGLAGDEQALIGQVSDAGREPEAQEVAQREDVVGEAGRVGGVLADPQAALVLEEPVEDVQRLVRGRGDDLGVEGAKLVGEVAVELDARFDAVAGVDGLAASP
jgi:hypothetical protein